MADLSLAAHEDKAPPESTGGAEQLLRSLAVVVSALKLLQGSKRLIKDDVPRRFNFSNFAEPPTIPKRTDPMS